MIKSDERGIFHVPMALALVVVTTAGIGILGMMHAWQTQAANQLQLDECVKETALALKSTLFQLQLTNRTMQANRLALIPATIAPPVRAGLTATLIAQYAYQELLIGAWNLRRVTWHISRGKCQGGAVQLPLPDLKVSRVPPEDELGPRPLEGLGKTRSFRIQRIHWPRSAAAIVELSEGSDDHWKAHWTVPYGKNRFF